MKILWAKTDFLHPTDRGGQIRTLETLKRLHERHEVHYLAYDNPAQPEGLLRAKEYCSFAYPVEHRIVEKTSPAFAAQLLAGLVSPLPVAVARWKSEAFERQLKIVLDKHSFDSIVCDFLFPAPNFASLSRCTLFQHNVEAMIWDRHAKQGRTPLHRWYFGMQARRMAAYEGEVCRAARNIIAVSEADAVMMRERYGASRIAAIATGVDTDFFRPPAQPAPMADLVFLGSMDWMPNIDGIQWFTDEIWPLILKQRPQTTLAIVGRKPTPAMLALGQKPGITVTGTVPDVRPWLHGSLVSIVPLRIGGGTRLKIYEAMAACAPVISTTIGAEGLDYQDGETIRIADAPALFAESCLDLLDNQAARNRMSEAALNLVANHYSWQAVTSQFERCLV